MKLYTVFCKCPTPLAENPMLVEAKDQDHAKELFFERNGISGSDHPIEITEDEPKKPVRKKADERSDNAGDDQK